MVKIIEAGMVNGGYACAIDAEDYETAKRMAMALFENRAVVEREAPPQEIEDEDEWEDEDDDEWEDYDVIEKLHESAKHFEKYPRRMEWSLSPTNF